MYLVACLSTGMILVVGCGQDRTVQPQPNISFFFPNLDEDGDNWFEPGESGTTADALCVGMELEEECAIAMRSSALRGGGDCDNDPTDDPQRCRTVEGVSCADEYYSVCAACINPAAPETCGDGVDNNCDGQIDEECPCLSDADCAETEECANGDCQAVFCPPMDCYTNDIINHECIRIRNEGCCVDNADCTRLETCDTRTHLCVPVDCGSENECDLAEVVNHQCEHSSIEGCCLSDEDCLETEQCHNTTSPNHCEAVVCEPRDACETTLVSAHECTRDRIQPPECCLSDSECFGMEEGEYCVNNVCTDIPCEPYNACDRAEVVDHECTHTEVPDCCLDSLECLEHQICNINNVCEDIVCESDDPCMEPVISNHRCTLQSVLGCCNVNDDCAATEICTVNHVCEAVVCEERTCFTYTVDSHVCQYEEIPGCCEYDDDCSTSEQCVNNTCVFVDPCGDVVCPVGQACFDGLCDHVSCDSANDLPSEDEGDCAPYRDEALATVTPPEGVTLADYGYGCLNNICVVYEDPEDDEWLPLSESWCADGVDGDQDGLTDMEDPDCSAECQQDADCEVGDNGTCVDGQCQYCTPACVGKECGSDGCGGSCGTCESGFYCDLTDSCVAEAPANELTVLYTVEASSLSGQDQIHLVMECRDGAGSVIVPWSVKDSAMAPWGTGTVSLTFTGLATDLADCKLNVSNQDGSWWAARCEGIGGTDCVANGEVSYTYGEDLVVTEVGTQDNDDDGLDWKFFPGTDSDGDMVNDDVDPCPYDASDSCDE